MCNQEEEETKWCYINFKLYKANMGKKLSGVWKNKVR